MTKPIKEFRDIIEGEGCTVVSIETGSKHYRATIENPLGQRAVMPIKLAGSGSTHGQLRGCRANARRFAKGITQGLRVTSGGKHDQG